MSDRVIIKEIDKQSIYVEDTLIYYTGWVIPTIGIVSFGIIFTSLYFSKPIPPIDIMSMVAICIAYGAISAILAFIPLAFSIMLNIGSKSVPAYEVGIDWDFEHFTFEKTTPELDQITICKHAKELEKKILEKRERIKELEEIAGKCK